MANSDSNIRHAKARGEWAELRFMTRAAELGLRVTKPWGDNSPYDFAVESRGQFFRIQVKCTQQKRSNSYVCCVGSNRGPYTPDQIDFVAAYVIPADAWYILPLAALHGYSDIWLTPPPKIKVLPLQRSLAFAAMPKPIAEAQSPSPIGFFHSLQGH
jgi:hypothetical protein